jgi:hypothetical protein
MIRAILRKEWQEHRSKYLGYWVALNVPVVLLALGVAFTQTGRVPFADLTNALTLKYLPLSLTEGMLVVTIFLILSGYLAVATFSPEIDDRSLFFVYEQPLARKTYLAIKLLNGACHVVLATCFAILLMPAASYVMMLLSGKVTVAGSGAAFGLVMAAAGRIAVWCSLISLGAFTGSALISALMPRWWLAALSSVALTVLFIGWATDHFSFLPDMPDDSMSVGVGFGSGNAPWITISRAFKPAEINAIAQWWPSPLMMIVLAIIVFSAATAFLYERKELK